LRQDALLKKAQTLRVQEHRLKPALRLRTVEDTVDFIHARGIVSMLGGNELPGLVSALMGREWKPTGKGFTSWLEWWSIQISGKNAGHLVADMGRRNDIIATRIFRNSKTFVSNRLWPTLDPIIRHYQDLAGKRKILSQLEWNILQTLGEKGPTRTDMLRPNLKLEGKQHTSRFHGALNRLEGLGIIVGYEDPKPEKHLHASIWHLWSQRVGLQERTATTRETALAELVERTLDASIFAQEKEVRNWFSWNGELAAAKDELVAKGRILRAGPFLFAPRISASPKVGTRRKP
jgi:hypothetical protein